MAVRLQDIASDLNLSKMTISKVLRGQTDVSAATKARVLQRVRELNYRPNVTARSLRTGHTQCAGLVVSSLAHPSVGLMTVGLNAVLRTAGYGLMIASADSAAEGETGMDRRIEETDAHLWGQVDVLFLLLEHTALREHGAAEATRRSAGEPERIRIYLGPFAEAGALGVNVFQVGVRERAIGQVAARHLMQNGCERLACVRGARTPGYDERLGGFLRAARACKRAPRAEWVVQGEPGAGEYQSGLQVGRRMFAGNAVPDGVAACTDLQACGVRDAALEAGLRVPEQVQVVGVGNRVEICEMGWAGSGAGAAGGMSSVDVAAQETGQQAAKLGLGLLANGAVPARTTIELTPKVVQRRSTMGGREAGGEALVAKQRVVNR